MFIKELHKNLLFLAYAKILKPIRWALLFLLNGKIYSSTGKTTEEEHAGYNASVWATSATTLLLDGRQRS